MMNVRSIPGKLLPTAMFEKFPDIPYEEYEGEVRVDVLMRLAEQAMSDEAFREVARDDLEGALKQFGYTLNEKELELVLRFRDALAQAGIDLFLDEQIKEDYQELLGRMAS